MWVRSARWGDARIDADGSGVARVRAAHPIARAYGLGFVHGRDRPTQMAVLRAAAQGRLAELLPAASTLRAQDLFFRRRGLAAASARDASLLAGERSDVAAAYCDGVDMARNRCGLPAEMALLSMPFERWTPADCLTLLRFQGYLGLSQVQEVTERLVAHTAIAGDDADNRALAACFGDRLAPFDARILRGGDPDTLLGPASPPARPAPLALPLDALRTGPLHATAASNALAVPGRLSRSGAPLLVGEPHLDVSVLPPAFVEAILQGPDGGAVGITLPGLPGVLAGRFPGVASAVTWGFPDAIDLFVEEVDGRGGVRRGDRFVPARRREETIRAGGQIERHTVWSTDGGVIEDAMATPGRVLATAFAGTAFDAGVVFSVPAMLERARSVDEARAAYALLPLGLRCVLADEAGRVGWQLGGVVPNRAGGRLRPRRAWRADEAWGRPAAPSDLPGATFAGADAPDWIAAANERPADADAAVTIALSPARRDGIVEALAARPLPWAVGDLLAAIRDDHDRLARQRIAQIAPLLPTDSPLRGWGGRVTVDATEPTLWARLEAAWLRDVWSGLLDRAGPDAAPGLGWDDGVGPEDADRAYVDASFALSSVPEFTTALFDASHPIHRGDWEGPLRGAIRRAHAAKARPWGRVNRIRRSWFLLAGTAVSRQFAGFIALPGNGSTPLQGRVHRVLGRSSAVAPVWRMTADLAEPGLRTALRGGPSDRPVSPRLRSDLARFERGETKALPGPIGS